MAKTRGGLSASPSSPTPRPQRAAMGAAPSPPVQAPAIPPSEGEVPSQRRYPTRRPPTDLCLHRASHELYFSAPQRGPGSRVPRAIPRASEPARGTSDSSGYASRDRYQASHDSRIADRG
ncbi:hypothetical protein AAG906_028017 [Vitis piasezkii]